MVNKDFQITKLKGALIGENVSFSLSKKLHESLNCDYDLISLPPQKLKDFLDGCSYDFVNVTMPYKKVVIDYLDQIDATVKAIGSCNTIIFKNGKKVGYNTDIDGFSFLFTKNNIDVTGKSVMILGTGGTSKTCQYYFKDKAKSVVVIGRREKVNYQNYFEHLDVDILVNTTPVGMNEYQSLVDLKMFKSLKFVADVIYSPLQTKLILDAKNLSIKCESGLDMLISQGIKAQEICRNQSLNGLQNYVKSKVLQGVKNIVLIGMPSSGKSVIGKILAQELNMDFLDIDDEVEKTLNMKISQVFERFGEEYFRKAESDVVNKIYLKKGLVIATGGGTVLNCDNLNKLKQNGLIIFINRDLDKLKTKNRPLSKEIGIENLWEKRKQIYQKAKDYQVFNNAKLNCAVKEIIDIYEKDIGN